MKNHASIDDQFLEKIHQLIEDNLDNEHFSVEDLARRAGLSRSMLHRKLIKLTNKSATDLITERRLILARELLENNMGTSSEVAYKVGFGSPSYFTKVFKKHYSISPGNVRKGATIPPNPDLPINQTGILAVARKIHRKRSVWLLIILVLIGATAGMYYKFGKKKPLEKSIAILPFDNLSPDKENQYFADGIVEDLINKLSTIKELKIISRTSSEMFRNKGGKTVPEIAKLLNVTYILEGAVQSHDDKVRINFQLIDALDDHYLLTSQYDRNLNEIFNVQSEIAYKIASELSIVLTEKQKHALKQHPTQNLKAFEYYQMGRFHASKRWIEGYTKSIAYYQKAIAEDPEYARAYAGLADNYSLMAMQGWIDYEKGWQKSIELADKAMELDPGLAGPHTVLGSYYIYKNGNWEKGEKELLQAIKLEPNYSSAHQYYAELLNIYGRNDEARTEINKALELDPFSFAIRYISALQYYNEEKFDEALAENKVCLDLVKDHEWALLLAARIYIQMGNDQTAFDYLKKYSEKNDAWSLEMADSIFNKGGLNAVIRWRLDSGKYKPEYTKRFWYAVLGEDEKAMEMLELAMKADSLGTSETNQIEYKNLRSNPRFIAIRKKMGLPPLPSAAPKSN